MQLSLKYNCRRLFAIRRIACLFLLFTNAVLQGQEVELKKSQELGITGAAICWTALNYTWQWNTPKVPNTYRRWNITGLDNFAQPALNSQIKKISDLTLGATILVSGLSIWNKEKSSTLNNGVVMLQSIWISANLTHTLKLAVKRARPYTLAKGFTFSQRDDTYSFFSGHSSMASAAITSAILMYDRTSANGQKIMLVSGGTLAAATMVLRVLAGKHYPSDVITGALVGMGIAWVNYRIHEK